MKNEVKHNSKKGWIVLDQIRTVDKQRILKVLASLTEKEIEKVKNVIKELLVDWEAYNKLRYKLRDPLLLVHFALNFLLLFFWWIGSGFKLYLWGTGNT